jgi:hypothetical protein
MTVKLAAVLTWSMLLVILMTAFETLRTWIMNHLGLPYYNPAGYWAFRPVHLRYHVIGECIGLIVEYWLIIVYWCGIVTFAEGLAEILLRSRLAAYICAIAIAISYQIAFCQSAVIPQFTLAPFGLLLAFAGITLYNKYAEV